MRQQPDLDGTTMRAALELAVRAPSLHNSQPWRWRLDGSIVHLYLDAARQLRATDPDARELVISCGAALHHLQVALADQGWQVRVRRLPDPAEPTLLASITLTGHLSAPADAGLGNAILGRRTDRRRFGSWPVPAELIGELLELADLRGARLLPVTEPTLRRRLFRAIAVAAERQAADPALTAELAAWSGRDPGAADGVPAAHVPELQRAPGQPPLRPFAHPQLHQSTHNGEPEAAALLLLSTTGDGPLQWLLAGEITSAALLAVTRDGLASSVLSQPLEVDDTRAFLRRHVAGGGPWQPQLVLRGRHRGRPTLPMRADRPFPERSARSTLEVEQPTSPRVRPTRGPTHDHQPGGSPDRARGPCVGHPPARSTTANPGGGRSPSKPCTGDRIDQAPAHHDWYSGWAGPRLAAHCPKPPPTRPGATTMKANRGDQIIVGVTAPDTPDRRGQVIEVLGHDTDEHYVVRWQDGHESIYYPGPDARVLEHKPRIAASRGRPTGSR